MHRKHLTWNAHVETAELSLITRLAILVFAWIVSYPSLPTLPLSPTAVLIWNKGGLACRRINFTNLQWTLSTCSSLLVHKKYCIKNLWGSTLFVLPQLLAGELDGVQPQFQLTGNWRLAFTAWELFHHLKHIRLGDVLLRQGDGSDKSVRQRNELLLNVDGTLIPPDQLNKKPINICMSLNTCPNTFVSIL